jgi:deoxyadenosine/deoxycytidine kinase
MPIICFEGASAVGKTSLSKYLSENFNVYVIPEVNLLFQRTPSEPKFWYFEKQIERWELAFNASKNYQIVILDGDPFQPLWYNWAYNFDVLQSLESTTDFYREKLADGKIAFPDKYFILTVNNDDLRKRKINDASRTRKNFERHLRFIKPQLAFFSFIKSINNDLIEFIENREVEKTAAKVINSIPLEHPNQDSSLALFDAAKIWLTETQAADFT